jgi:hypothetical protein
MCIYNMQYQNLSRVLTIDDFVLACSIDNSPAYFTYEGNTMIIIASQEACRRGSNDFENIEPYIESLIAHESIHVVIKQMEGAEISDSLDDIELIVERNGYKFQVTINNILFATDSSGIVTP